LLYLLIVSLIWAFSFGLIKTSLAGIDSNAVAAARLGIALLVFLPFFRWRGLDRPTALRLLGIGAVQYGGMYVAYLAAFPYLKAYEVALFTLFTPLYVTLLDDLYQRRVKWFSLAAVGLAMLAAWVVQKNPFSETGLGIGFTLVQVSNLCFAYGQIAYRRLLHGRAISDGQIFALPYLGGVLVALAAAALTARPETLAISLPQGLTLLYLGAVASGLGFFLWNLGARRVEAGMLAIFNDLKIPLAVLVSVVVFGEQANWLRLLLGLGLGLAALWVNQRGQHQAAEQASATQAPI
jgi:drug/metabolite transporter (DMT)-like permease